MAATPWSLVVVTHDERQVDISLDDDHLRFHNNTEIRPATLQDLRALLVTPAGGQLAFFDHLHNCRDIVNVVGTVGFTGVDTLLITIGERWLPRLVITPTGATYHSYYGERPGATDDLVGLFKAVDCPRFTLLRVPKQLQPLASAAAR